MQQRPLWRLALAVTLFAGCAVGDATDDSDESESTAASSITSSGAWYHLDDFDSMTTAATLTVVNGYKVRCPDGASSRTCHVATLVLPADCDWECKDGLLSLRGEGVLRGRFDGDSFVATAGFDTFECGLGGYSIYRLTAAPTCAHDPCPSLISAQKLNTTRAPTTVKSVDFTHAADPNYVLDPTRGDDQVASSAGLVVSGHIVSHVFRADRVWRLWTPKPACDAQLTARAHAYGGDGEIVQYRTVYEAERAVIAEGTNGWLVRTAESPTSVEFTSGINDLWAERFAVRKSDCAITTLAEH
jgi:hypothetical protein